MRKNRFLWNAGIVAGILFFLSVTTSCNRTEYDLLDPADAGVWTFFDTGDGLPGNQVMDIQLDSKQNLWFTFPGYGTAKYNGDVWTYYKTANSPILTNTVYCLAEDISGNIIFGTSTGLSILSTTNQWDSKLTSIIINTIKVASNGSVWVGTKDQGFYVNSGSGFVKVYSDQYKNVNVIEEGTSGIIWLGTDNGLIKWDGTSYTYKSTADGLPVNKVSSLLFDSKGRLWLGTRGGKTASWIDRKDQIHQLSLFIGKDSCTINDILEDRKGDVWFATNSDGLIRYDGVIPHSYKEINGFPENTVHAIGQDKDGNLWFGLDKKGLAKYILPIN